MRTLLLLLLLIPSFALASDLKKDAIFSVQVSNSVLEGTTTLKYIDILLNISEQSGNYIDVDGWLASKKNSKNDYDIYFLFKENEQDKKLHWVISNQKIYSVDPVSKQITPPQKAQFFYPEK